MCVRTCLELLGHPVCIFNCNFFLFFQSYTCSYFLFCMYRLTLSRLEAERYCNRETEDEEETIERANLDEQLSGVGESFPY